jgi:F-type H+-transporting ATPase subunit b
MKHWLLLATVASVSLLGQEPAEHNGDSTTQVEETSSAWKWANFAILAIGLGYLMAKHLPPLFRSRTSEIQKGISEAQQMKMDAERRSAEMDARLNAIGEEIERFRKQSAAEMQQEGERIGRETAAQIKRIELQAEAEIESAGKAVRRQLKDFAADLALGLAEERLRTRIDSATASELVDDFVHNLERNVSPNGSQKGARN